MKRKNVDYPLIIIVSIIACFGLFVLASTTSFGSGSDFFKQIILGFLPGILLAFFFFKIPLNLLKKWSPYLFLGNIFLLLLIFVPYFEHAIRGSSRWISFGPLIFQPTELLKLTFILYLSSWIINKTKKQQKDPFLSFKEILLPFFIVAFLVSVLLLLQPDMSTLVIILSTAFVIYFVAKTPLWHTGTIFLTGIAAFAIMIYTAPYRIERIMGIINPSSDPLGKTYQIRQLLIAVGSGGIFGLGPGMSVQKYGFVPLSSTDSIFAILAEEMGFLGGIILIALFFLFFYRGFLIAKNNTDSFARLVAFGICFWIFLQTFINIGVTVGIVPVTGIPLPLISYGKSHLIVELAAIGILLNASQYVRK
jgi:cell division protein FtsW